MYGLAYKQQQMLLKFDDFQPVHRITVCKDACAHVGRQCSKSWHRPVSITGQISCCLKVAMLACNLVLPVQRYVCVPLRAHACCCVTVLGQCLCLAPKLIWVHCCNSVEHAHAFCLSFLSPCFLGSPYCVGKSHSLPVAALASAIIRCLCIG